MELRLIQTLQCGVRRLQACLEYLHKFVCLINSIVFSNNSSSLLIEKIEIIIQKMATKLVHECKRLSYSDRIKYLNLPTLSFKRCRGDMIETFETDF